MTTRKPIVRGIIPPMITPMKDNNTLDAEGARRLVEHMIAGGVHGIFILGTTGEAQSLSYPLRYELTDLVCTQVAGRVPVLVGITDTSLEESLRLARKAADCGAAAVVSAPPYYFAPSQQELIEYYTALADRLPLPLYLYNMPSHVKVMIEPVRSVSPVMRISPSLAPRWKDISWILPPLWTSTVNHSDRAFTTLAPTPCRPPETL